MMLGLGVGNPIAGFITSKYGISKWNAVAGAVLLVIFSGLITRWNADTSRAEAYVELVFLGGGQGAMMSGLLLSAQVAVEPMLIGIVTGLVILMLATGNMFGIAFFSAVYINELSVRLSQLSLTPEKIGQVLRDVQVVKQFEPDLRTMIVHAWADSLKNGWWLMFATACATLIAALLARQHKFG